MAWTTPKTDWNTGELVTAADINAIGENVAILNNRGSAAVSTSQDIVVGAISEFADVDSNNLNLTITTTGRDVMIYFRGSTRRHDKIGFGDNYLTFAVDGRQEGGTDGLSKYGYNSGYATVSLTHFIQNLAAGSHTFKLKWRPTRSITLEAGAQFAVYEI